MFKVVSTIFVFSSGFYGFCEFLSFACLRFVDVSSLSLVCQGFSEVFESCLMDFFRVLPKPTS